MPLPVLALFAAGAGLQQLGRERKKRRGEEADIREVERLREIVGTARNTGVISPQDAAFLDIAAIDGNTSEVLSAINAAATRKLRTEEFNLSFDVTSDENRADREQTIATHDLAVEQHALSVRKADEAVDVELQTQLTIAKNLNVRTAHDPVFGDVSVPTRISPEFKTGLDDLRQTTNEAGKINQLVDFVTTQGIQRDPSAPITTLMKSLYNDVIAFKIEDLGFGVPQAAEFLRVEQGNPDPTAFWAAMARGDPAVLAPMMQILEAKNRQLGNIVRDQRNWNVDRIDTDRALAQIASGAELGPAAVKRIGDILQSAGGQTAGITERVAAGIGTLSSTMNLLLNPEDETAGARLRRSQDAAKALGGDAPGGPVIPGSLPRQAAGGAQGLIDLIATFAKKGR